MRNSNKMARSVRWGLAVAGSICLLTADDRFEFAVIGDMPYGPATGAEPNRSTASAARPSATWDALLFSAQARYVPACAGGMRPSGSHGIAGLVVGLLQGVGLVSGVLSWVLSAVYAGPLAYVLLLAFAAVATSGSPLDRLRYAIVLATMHLCWGAGFLRGALRGGAGSLDRSRH